MDTTQQLTTAQRQADAQLQARGTTLRQFLEASRAAGRSYESTAKELFLITNGGVEVTYQTIGRWLTDLDIEIVASSS